MPTIRELREGAGLTQLQVATALGVTPTTVYHWERGSKMPSGLHLQRLAHLLGVPADDVVLRERDERPEGKAAA